MLGRVALRLCGSIWFVALLAAPMTVAAQCRLCSGEAQPSAVIQNTPAPAFEVETNLHFGGLLLTGTDDGGAILRPDGSTTISGGLAGVSGQRMAGTVRVRGEAGRMIRVDMPQRVELHSISGEVLVIEEILTDLPSTPRLDSAGGLTFHFGGSLKIPGSADGEYRGDLPLTIDYL